MEKNQREQDIEKRKDKKRESHRMGIVFCVVLNSAAFVWLPTSNEVDKQAGELHSDEVLPLIRVRHFRVSVDELGYFVRINVVRGAVIVARHIVHALVASRLHSEHAGSLAMEELAALGLTPASIAKVGAFEYVALVAVGAFRAVA
jgi:hypothetical protein